MATVASAAASTPARVLIYSATADFRHDSIPTARDAIVAQGSANNIQFDATEDSSQFTDETLSAYDALIFLMNTGEGTFTGLFPTLSCLAYNPCGGFRIVLDASGKAALQNYLDLGGNFVAIHAASDALRNTTFYGNEVGKLTYTNDPHHLLPWDPDCLVRCFL